ncbi:protein of unknown function [Nitrosomonas marina]|uniref:DUF4340 domain-containing protein n=1 Tax=Nitrosomonas marina TaxID=917 RepID=A0A1I0DJ73_9PROT|nr:DUF4340 domain-containing protein [Nitrosomonas marina]SET32511.1 protein of unknown function [Nitrosomonas marina]
MTYHSQINLIMLATIVGLAIFLYLTPQFQSDNDEAFQVSVRTSESVQSIRIVRQEQEIELKRMMDGWYMVAPVFARADATAIEKLLNVLTANSRQRFPLKDVERFNLDQPVIELYIDDDYFAFGGFAPVTNEQYLAINGDVYLVSPRYAIWIPLNPLELINSTLMSDDELPVRFELNDMSVNYQNGTWQIDPEKAINQNGDTLERWVQLWRDSRAIELMIKPQHNADDKVVAKIDFKDGRNVVITAVDDASRVVFYRANEQIGYLFTDSVSRQLLNPAGIGQE